MAFDHTPPHHPQTAAAAEQPRAWHKPVLTPLGSLQALTAGGSAQNQTEAWIFNCTSQNIFIRC